MQKFAADNDVDLRKSYFYADGDEDVALMYLVGNPRPTNPEGKLAAVAAKRGWPILRFSSRSGSSPVSALRTLAGMASMAPVAAGAIGVGLLAGNKRRGVNFFTSNWGSLLLAATGVHLNVIGEENLTAVRPAVFIFNHRNQADPVIAGALVRDNFTSVGKKELEKNPIMGTLGKVMDAAFIDRENPKAAVEELKKVEELARKGLSILIAPEGTRLDTTEVGPFKKGPFRIAMAAGIPIVPIVIRNAEVIAARDSNTFNPGTVDVIVYPAIPIDDWTVENLPGKIAEVRQLYLDTLKNWPRDEVPETKLTRQAEERQAEERQADERRAEEDPRKESPRQESPGKDDSEKGNENDSEKARNRRQFESCHESDEDHESHKTTKADEASRHTRAPMSNSLDYLASFTATDDALVLASVSSAAERELLDNWLRQQRKDHPDTKVEALELPGEDPPPAVVAQLVEQLSADEDRSVVPVRVFWVPGGLPTRVKLVGLISGRDTYRPPEILQRRILRKDPSAGACGGGGAGQGFRASPAVAGHHGRRESA